ncbi:hypothetical protein [Methylobacterium sp. 77]|uniref:hypothetical protein n=1 Tax=Methylobacterium sp. 77 TaxID=1101192 RepID=UPI00056291B3|nr:hypothetical protein [Methylobacterium sp. 77]
MSGTNDGAVLIGRMISLYDRKAVNALATDDGPVMLIKKTQASLRRSTCSNDPTIRFSMDPLRYGNRPMASDRNRFVRCAPDCNQAKSLREEEMTVAKELSEAKAANARVLMGAIITASQAMAA